MPSRRVIDIRPMRATENTDCESILRALPGWFGIESSLMQYVEDTRKYPTWVAFVDRKEAALGGKKCAAGFVSLHEHFPKAAEIHVIAVRPEFHGRGVGRAMVEFAERWLLERGVEYLQVKTMGPSKPNKEYARTTEFYKAVGFAPLEEFIGLWGGLPALQLVKRLGRRDRMS